MVYVDQGCLVDEMVVRAHRFCLEELIMSSEKDELTYSVSLHFSILHSIKRVYYKFTFILQREF